LGLLWDQGLCESFSTPCLLAAPTVTKKTVPLGAHTHTYTGGSHGADALEDALTREKDNNWRIFLDEGWLVRGLWAGASPHPRDGEQVGSARGRPCLRALAVGTEEQGEEGLGLWPLVLSHWTRPAPAPVPERGAGTKHPCTRAVGPAPPLLPSPRGGQGRNTLAPVPLGPPRPCSRPREGGRDETPLHPCQKKSEKESGKKESAIKANHFPGSAGNRRSSALGGCSCGT
jgi:hypothetical protein